MGALALGALLVAVLALGLAVVVFFAFVAGLALVAAVFAVFALGAALVLVTFGLVSVFSFLGAAAFFSAGLASFFASLTGPEGPVTNRSAHVAAQEKAGDQLTLWLREVAFVNTTLQCLVEQGVELSLRGHGDFVVGLDVFLDALSATKESVHVHWSSDDDVTWKESELTCYHFAP